MSDLSNCGNQSQQWTAKHPHQLWLWHVWQPFDTSDTEEQPPSCFSFLLSFFWGSVWIYDGELKWSGRKNYWCLSKYDSSSTQMSVWVLQILYHLFCAMYLLFFSSFSFFFHFFLLSNVLPYKKTACLKWGLSFQEWNVNVALFSSAGLHTLIMRWNYLFLSWGGMGFSYIHPIMANVFLI